MFFSWDDTTMEEVQPPVTPPIDPNGKRSEAILSDLCEVLLFIFACLYTLYVDTTEDDLKIR